MLRRLFVIFRLLPWLSPAPAAAQDAADAIVRLNRLESQFRQLSGQIEQLQYENRQLKDQLRKFQEDVEFRFQESRGGSRPRSRPLRDALASGPGSAAADAGPAPAPQRRLRSRRSAGCARRAAAARLDAAIARRWRPDAGRPDAAAGRALAGIGDLIEQDERRAARRSICTRPARPRPPCPQGAIVERPGPSVAATSVGDPRADYDAAYAYFTQKQYEQAEMGFRRFLQSNPRDKLVPEATFWLGETYLQRSRYREAAEQFLNVSTEHPERRQGPRRPAEARRLAERARRQDRACAVFAELDRKYPQASAPVRQASEREQKRVKCS